MPENKTNNSNAETESNESTAHAMRVAPTTDSAVTATTNAAKADAGVAAAASGSDAESNAVGASRAAARSDVDAAFGLGCSSAEGKSETANLCGGDAGSGAGAGEVSSADVDWIDHYGSALIHGFRFTPGDIAAFEHHRDRDHTGRLSVWAKERIARILTCELDERAGLWARARQAYRAERLSEGVAEPSSFQGPADTGMSARTGGIAPAQRDSGASQDRAGNRIGASESRQTESDCLVRSDVQNLTDTGVDRPRPGVTPRPAADATATPVGAGSGTKPDGGAATRIPDAVPTHTPERESGSARNPHTSGSGRAGASTLPDLSGLDGTGIASGDPPTEESISVPEVLPAE